MPRTLRSQLAEIGVSPDRVDYLGLSHLHVDHVGNVDLFPRATALLQRAEHEAGYGPDPERFTLIPETYAALNRERIEVVDGEHDLFGDALAVLKPLPGHTPGHQGLLVALPETGPILLAGDIAYSAADYAESAAHAANVDLEASRRSIAAATALERRSRRDGVAAPRSPGPAERAHRAILLPLSQRSVVHSPRSRSRRRRLRPARSKACRSVSRPWV